MCQELDHTQYDSDIEHGDLHHLHPYTYYQLCLSINLYKNCIEVLIFSRFKNCSKYHQKIMNALKILPLKCDL